MINSALLADRISASGLTHFELAKLIGISKNTFSAIMTGKKSPTIEQVDTICNVLNITDNNAKAQIFLSESSR
jgi:transcriptional regulator with XRE-family HTH domain